MTQSDDEFNIVLDKEMGGGLASRRIQNGDVGLGNTITTSMPSYDPWKYPYPYQYNIPFKFNENIYDSKIVHKDDNFIIVEYESVFSVIDNEFNVV